MPVLDLTFHICVVEASSLSKMFLVPFFLSRFYCKNKRT